MLTQKTQKILFLLISYWYRKSDTRMFLLLKWREYPRDGGFNAGAKICALDLGADL